MYPIQKDKTFQKYLRAKHNLSEDTKLKYTRELNKFCTYTQQTFTELIQSLLEEQNDKIDLDKGIIIKFNKETSTLADQIEEYVHQCRQDNEKEQTIQNRIRNIYTILHHFNVETPRFPEFKVDNTQWTLLQKEDIKYLLKDIGKDIKPLLLFLACTGERIGDVVEWKIQDHLQNTIEYHGCTKLEDYLNQPFNKDTIAIYEFYPKKTRRNNILCRHGVTPETCEAIYDYLKERKLKVDRLYQQGKVERKLSEKDYLFVPRGNLLGKRARHGVISSFQYQNKKLKNHYIECYDREMKKGEIDKDTYDEKVKNIPKFHAHALRKYFISTVRRNCSNLSVCVQMEGHSLPLVTDGNYVKLGKEVIKKEYLRLIPHLTFNDDVVVRVLTDEKILEYESRLSEQQSKLDSLEELVNSIRDFPYD